MLLLLLLGHTLGLRPTREVKEELVEPPLLSTASGVPGRGARIGSATMANKTTRGFQGSIVVNQNEFIKQSLDLNTPPVEDTVSFLSV